MPLTLKDASGAEVQVPTSEEIAEMITGATKRQIESANKKLGETLLKEVAESVKSTLDEYETARSSSEKEKAGSSESQQPDIEKHPIVAGLKKQLEALAKDNEKTKAEAAAEKAKQRDLSLRQRLTEQLAKVGITDARQQKGAIALLLDADKRVKFADEGDALSFRDDDGSELDLTTGLKSWAKSEEAKIYLPPRGASGSGDRSGGKSSSQAAGSGGAPMTRTDLGNQLLGMIGRMDATTSLDGT